MRLIDADKLILYLNDYALQAAPFRGERAEAYNAIKQCIEAVEEQPTAYDPDNVVEELEEIKSNGRYVQGNKAGQKIGYNKAIDDFVKFANTMPTVETEDGEIRPMWLEEMAEQLKAGGVDV